MTSDQITGLLIRTIPYPEQIRDLETEDSEHNAIKFSWRDTEFRVSSHSDHEIDVDEVEDGCLIGSNISMLLTALLKRAITSSL